MSNQLTRSFVIAATVLGGLLAGMALDKSLVQFPLWRHAGAQAWAAYTRQIDLGRGLILYPALGLSALFCSVAAAIAFSVNRAFPRPAAIPVYAAAVLAIAALIITRYLIAPSTLGIRAIGDNPAALQNAFNVVQTWWPAKAGLHGLTFIANVWSLIALTR